MDKYPQMLFRMPGVEPMHDGFYSTMIVNSDEEQEAALDEGWHETTPAAKEAHEQSLKAQAEAIAAKPIASDDNKPPTREELEQKATELGIPFSARVSDKKLAEAIAAKLAEQ